MTDWIREISEVVCPICEEYYLIRDKCKKKRVKNITLDNGKKIRLGKIKKRDNLECTSCGIIRKYKGERTIVMTEENYREWQISHGTLEYKKFKRKIIQKHLDRLHALKNLKKYGSNSYFYIIEQLGYDNIMTGLMEGINRIGYKLRVGILRFGSNKNEINVPLLKFLMGKIKEEAIK